MLIIEAVWSSESRGIFKAYIFFFLKEVMQKQTRNEEFLVSIDFTKAWIKI